LRSDCFLAFAVLYGTSTLLPALLESLFGYDAFHAGLVLSPSGVSAILALIVVGALLGRRLDARWLIAAGLLILAAGNFWMSQLNLDISPWQAVWPCAARPSASSRYCATRAVASALQWARLSSSAARYSMRCG
jgi:DHA2 family multidrug resistance protein